MKIEWNNGMSSQQPRIVTVQGRHVGIPKKPVVWIGELWFQVAHGERDIRAFRSNGPITQSQVKEVLAMLHARLVGEHGTDGVVNSGFWVQSR